MPKEQMPVPGQNPEEISPPEELKVGEEQLRIFEMAELEKQDAERVKESLRLKSEIIQDIIKNGIKGKPTGVGGPYLSVYEVSIMGNDSYNTLRECKIFMNKEGELQYHDRDGFSVPLKIFSGIKCYKDKSEITVNLSGENVKKLEEIIFPEGSYPEKNKRFFEILKDAKYAEYLDYGEEDVYMDLIALPDYENKTIIKIPVPIFGHELLSNDNPNKEEIISYLKSKIPQVEVGKRE